VPDNYFEEFPGRLKQRLQQEMHKKEVQPASTRMPKYFRIATVAAAAAVIGIFFMLNTLILKPREEGARNEEIATMLQDDVYDLDEYYLETGIDQTYSEKQKLAGSGKNAYKDAIIDYLMDEQIDLETIVSEL
jgi:hypothetical protein